MTPREKVLTIFNAAVLAVQPDQLIPVQIWLEGDTLHIFDNIIDLKKAPKIFVIGGGKASAAMARSMEFILGDRITAGLIVTKYLHSLPLDYITCLEAAHPVPDEQGIKATAEMMQLLQQAGANDIVICLVSGGASALLVDLPDGISLADLQIVFQLLLRSGASIDEINTVRKHLSEIKGGQLLRFAPASCWYSLVISDVPGDDLSVIASGLTVPDSSSFADVGDILDRYQLWKLLPEAVRLHIEGGISGVIADTPKPGDLVFNKVHNTIIGSNRIALEAAMAKARELGFDPPVLKPELTGDAGLAGKENLLDYENYQGRLPVCFLAGGETTVVVGGSGKGGRNQHLALSALCAMTGNKNITLLAAGTDGTDGPTDAAGAIIDTASIETAHNLGLDPKAYFHNHDAYHFFEKIGGLLKTGATQTNVMDLLIAIIE